MQNKYVRGFRKGSFDHLVECKKCYQQVIKGSEKNHSCFFESTHNEIN